MSEPKVVLVTGATRGIGRGIAERLLEHGRHVVACARDAGALDAFARAHEGRVTALPIDLGEHGAAEWAVDEAVRLAGHLDELVCAAGIVRYQSVGRVREVDLRAQLELNFVAPTLMTQRAGVHMRSRRRGAVVLVASTLGISPAPQTSAYAASKAALISTARSYARELAPEVRVNALAPGVVDTDMIRVPREHEPVDAEERVRVVREQLAHLESLHPLRRLGTASEIAEAAHFLLDASWITGTVLTIDGGLSVA